MKKYTEKRPWGKFEKYTENEKCCVKILFVNPNEEFSLQYHEKRDEFWKIIQGTAEIVIGDKKTQAKENDEFFIPAKEKHRAIAGAGVVKILEISFGDFDENDIIRLEDKYSRT